MRKAGLAAVACSFLWIACTGGSFEPEVKAPNIDEGRITLAKVAGRDLPFFTFTSRVLESKAEVVAARLAVSTTGDLHSGGELTSAQTLEAQFIAKHHQLRFITDAVKNKDLETTLNEDDAEVAFRWEIDFTGPESDTVHTTKSVIYKTNHKDIAAANLAHEIK